MTRAPSYGHSRSTRATCLQPSTNAGHRRVSYQSASASLAWPGTSTRALTRPTGLDPELAADEVDAGGDGGGARRELDREPVALGLALRREAVEAPRAALGVLPLAADELLLLERPQQRIHRVRVDRDEPAGQLAHALHELVAVRRLAGEEVQDEQREQPGAAQLADERGLRAGPARAGRPPPPPARPPRRAVSSGAASATARSVGRSGIRGDRSGPTAVTRRASGRAVPG